MDSIRLKFALWFTLILLSLATIPSLASECSDPNCLSVDDAAHQVRPAVRVRNNLITGMASAPSGAVIEDIVREDKPAPKRLKIRKYPLDLSVKTTISLGFGDVLQFTHKDVKYIVNVVSFDANNAQFKFMPTREFSNISPQEKKVYDVDHDGNPDFGLKMGTVENNQADFVVIPTFEASIVEEPLYVPPPQPTPSISATRPPPPPSQESFPEQSEPVGPPPQITSISSELNPQSLPEPSAIPSTPVYQPIAESPGGILAEPEQVSAPQAQDGVSMMTWAMLAGIIGLLTLVGATVVVLRREQAHVDTVIDYMLKSLGRKIPLAQAVDALGKAGWGKRAIDKAMASIATRYKLDGAQKGNSEDDVRTQLTEAGMPEEVLSHVFKKKSL